MAAIICPNVDDPVLQVGVAAYAVVIGTMAYHSLILANVEQNLKNVIYMAKEQLPNKKEFTYVFYNTIYHQDAGELTLPGNWSIRLHVIGSILFLISDSILGYSQFVEKQQRGLAVMITYFASLIFFGLSAMSDMICTKCILK